MNTSNEVPEKLRSQLQAVRLFLCDVDGILTDTAVWMGAEDELKRFNIQDGLGMRLIQKEGIKVGWVSNRPSFATSQRAADLKIDILVHNYDGDKGAAVGRILKQSDRKSEQLCYLDDDIVDHRVLKRCGFAVTVPHAIREAKEMTHYVTEREGGHGAVREVIELI